MGEELNDRGTKCPDDQISERYLENRADYKSGKQAAGQESQGSFKGLSMDNPGLSKAHSGKFCGHVPENDECKAQIGDFGRKYQENDKYCHQERGHGREPPDDE